MQTRERDHSIFTPPSETIQQERCVTCEQPIDTPYCAHCGEKRASDRTHSLWDFIKDHVVESVMSFDGRVIRTLKTLLRKPGELTREFMRGVRLPYLAPLQCFLLLNLGFFLWSSWSRTRIFDTQLYVHMNVQPYSGLATRMVREYLAFHELALTAYTARFDAIGAGQARSLVLAMVPAFALCVGLLMLRRNRQDPVVKHLVFALHSFSFIFVLFVAAHYVIDYPLNFILGKLGVARDPELGYDMADSIVSLSVMVAYLSLSLRRAYDVGRLRAALSGAGLGFLFYVVLQMYRTLLFFVTFYSM